jgi:MYXO-CTERM domain-containing protein
MRLPSSSRRAAVLAASSLVALAAVVKAAPARANGRYPASGQIAVAPMDPKTILVRATYGLMLSRNGGQTWAWICEPAVGYSGVEDPMMSFMANGNLLAGIFEGLSVGSPDGCQWGFIGGGLLGKYVIDLSVDAVDPTQAVLIISNNAGQDDAGSQIFLGQLWQTSDNGATWAQAGVNLDPEYLGLTVDTAPSNPMRVYSSGRTGPPDYPGMLERSDDRGGTWQALPIPGADDTHLPYIGAVDPNDPDVVYVRIDADPSDVLLVTKDGGMTWSTIFTATGKLNGFALSPDGATVAIGGPGLSLDGGPPADAGVWTAPASTLQFTKQSSVGALCLTWVAGGLYACADEFTNGFTAGVSADQGKTFTPLMHLAGICPLTCDEPDSGVTSQCPAAWPLTAYTIGGTCDIDAGTGGTGAGGSPSASATTGTGSGAAASAKGCSCSLPAGAEGGAAAVSFLALAAALRRRRR